MAGPGRSATRRSSVGRHQVPQEGSCVVVRSSPLLSRPPSVWGCCSRPWPRRPRRRPRRPMTPPRCSPPRVSTRTGRTSRLRQAARRLLLEPAALRRRPADRQPGGRAAVKAAHARRGRSPTTRARARPRGGTWTSQGPNPIVQNGRTTNAFQAVSGRIGALAIRNDGTIILGAAQGGVWTYDADHEDLDLAHQRHRHPVGRRAGHRAEQRQPSSTWAPARAPSPATATTATASTSPPTAA